MLLFLSFYVPLLSRRPAQDTSSRFVSCIRRCTVGVASERSDLRMLITGYALRCYEQLLIGGGDQNVTQDVCTAVHSEWCFTNRRCSRVLLPVAHSSHEWKATLCRRNDGPSTTEWAPKEGSIFSSNGPLRARPGMEAKLVLPEGSNAGVSGRPETGP